MRNVPSTAIRSAAPDEMPHAVAAIVAAFLVDPTARFAWPDARHYLEAMPLAIGQFADACVERGTAYVSGDLRGAALWLPPGVQPDGEAMEKVFRDTAKPAHLDDLLATFEKMDQSHPKEAHWYLSMIGVDPKSQGQGVGAELMRYSRCPLRSRGRTGLPGDGEPAQHPALRAVRLRGHGAVSDRGRTAGDADAPAAALTVP